jgi:hypothetical protein
MTKGRSFPRVALSFRCLTGRPPLSPLSDLAALRASYFGPRPVCRILWLYGVRIQFGAATWFWVARIAEQLTRTQPMRGGGEDGGRSRQCRLSARTGVVPSDGRDA